MKITDISIYAGEYAQTSRSKTNKKWVFLKMETDEGFYGWGEVGTSVNVSENFMATAIREVTPQLIGENPMDIDMRTLILSQDKLPGLIFE